MARKYRRKIHMLMAGVLLILLFFLEACSAPATKPKEQATDENASGGEAEARTEEEQAASDSIYILLYTNNETEKLFLQDTQTRRQEEYSYNGGTYIKNKYGDNMTVSQLEPGELMKIQATEKMVLTEVRLTEDTFTYEDVTNFTIDGEENIFTSSGSNYFYDDALKVFSGGGLVALSELSSQDTVCIRGVGKKILTIVVTKGHGTVTLKNTDIFEGGMVTLGNIVIEEITRNMQMEVPEGSYTISVANEGYGGSQEINVNRSEETIVNLNDLKGEGPKSCSLKINVTPENATVNINGGQADCAQLLDLSYGVYTVTAQAEGYQNYSGKLVVNSEEAAVSVILKQTGTDTTEDSESKDSGTDSSGGSNESSSSGNGRKAGSLAGSLSGGQSGGSTGTESNGTSGGTGSSLTGSSSDSALNAARIISGLDGTGTDSSLKTQLISELVDSLLKDSTGGTSSSDGNN